MREGSSDERKQQRKIRHRLGSSRPLPNPNATDPEIVGKVIHLRRSYYFGPARISMYLRRYHDVAISPSGCGASSSGSS
jgi:hypothetical protein